MSQLYRPGESDSGSKRERSLLLDPQKVNSKSCRSGYQYHVRKVRSRGSLFLILLWSIAVWCATFTVTLKLGPDLLPPRLALIPGAIQSVVFLLYCPFAGWLADVYFGRYKVIHANLLLIWIGSIVAVLGLILGYLFPNTATLLAHCVLFPAYVVMLAGNGGFVVNVVPFGTDQMPDASAEEVSAFIVWFVWAWYVGDLILQLGSVILDCTKTLSSGEANMVHLLIAVTVMSIALCSDYLLHNWLTIEPQSQNPLKSVIDVLKYAATHKYPTRRSAFTYWEEEIPSRVDLGKSKYGGPFTNEQVEDVKTFFRILVVVTSISAFIIPIEAVLSNFPAAHYKATVNASRLSASKIHYFAIVVVLGVPFYELVIYPLAWKWIPSMLKRVGAGALVTIGLSIILMTVDAIGHAKTNDVPCMFNANSSSPKLDISYLWVDVPFSVLLAVQVIVFYSTVFEFICAQSPYSMKGLLTGCAFAVITFTETIGDIIALVWSLHWPAVYSTPSCGFWYYLFTALIGIIGLVVLVIVAKWYRRRERDEIVNERVFAENYYSCNPSLSGTI